MIKLRVLEPIDFLVAEHGVGLARAGGPISKYSGVEAVEDGLDEALHGLGVNLREGALTMSEGWLR